MPGARCAAPPPGGSARSPGSPSSRSPSPSGRAGAWGRWSPARSGSWPRWRPTPRRSRALPDRPIGAAGSIACSSTRRPPPSRWGPGSAGVCSSTAGSPIPFAFAPTRWRPHSSPGTACSSSRGAVGAYAAARSSPTRCGRRSTSSASSGYRATRSRCAAAGSRSTAGRSPSPTRNTRARASVRTPASAGSGPTSSPRVAIPPRRRSRPGVHSSSRPGITSCSATTAARASTAAITASLPAARSSGARCSSSSRATRCRGGCAGRGWGSASSRVSARGRRRRPRRSSRP